MVTNLHILCRNLAKNAIGNDIITKLPRYTQKEGAFRIKMRSKIALERAEPDTAQNLLNSVPAHKAASAPPPMSAVRAPYHVRLA